jgi:hypothetical protein
MPNMSAYPNIITTGSLSCSGWYDDLVAKSRMTERNFDYISQDLGFEGNDDFNVVQGVFDNQNQRDIDKSDSRAVLLSMRDERWVSSTDILESHLRRTQDMGSISSSRSFKMKRGLEMVTGRPFEGGKKIKSKSVIIPKKRKGLFEK